MRALVQRVSEASVSIDGAEVGRIGDGLCVLVGVTHEDTVDVADRVADKVWNLRLMEDEQSVAETTGEVLVVSQFTLYGDARKGRRPTWSAAAPPEHAEPLVQRVCSRLSELGATVATGRFRAEMDVALVNRGPVTLLVELT